MAILSKPARGDNREVDRTGRYSDQYRWRRGIATFGTKPVSGTGARPFSRRTSFSSSQWNALRLLTV